MEMVVEKRRKFHVRDPFSALTHFIGFLAVIPPVICLLERAETTEQMVSFVIFGISLLLLYGASTIYHTLCLAPEKIAFLRRIDHMMIFVLIAGTYTPVCMVILPGIWGKALLAAVWGVAIFGIFMKIFWMNVPRWISTLIYVGMGWLAVTAFVPLKVAIGWGGLGMLLAGGIVYTIGAVIYALKKPNLAILKSFGFHEIFHVFVMLGSALHIAFMFLYAL